MASNVIQFPVRPDRDSIRSGLARVLADRSIVLGADEQREVVDAIAAYVDLEFPRELLSGIQPPAECAEVIDQLAKKVHVECVTRAASALLDAYVFFYTVRRR